MDGESLALANARVGNQRGAPAIEWALAGGSIRFSEHALAAFAGADAELARNGAPVGRNVAVEFSPGDELTVGQFMQGAYLYIAVRGGFDVPLVLGSRSTYISAGFGGLGGRRLRAGDILRRGAAIAGNVPPVTPDAPAQPGDAPWRPIRAIEGPNTTAFSAKFRESFWASEFTVSRNVNRAGYQLHREPGGDPGSMTAPSEPACVGAIQVSSGAGAIVLMADGPTVGGYPKIGVVATVDIPALAQKTPGEIVRFERVTLEDARRILRAETR